MKPHSIHIKLRYVFKKRKVKKKQNYIIKLDGVAPLIADPPPLKIHQLAKSTPSVKWP